MELVIDWAGPQKENPLLTIRVQSILSDLKNKYLEKKIFSGLGTIYTYPDKRVLYLKAPITDFNSDIRILYLINFPHKRIKIFYENNHITVEGVSELMAKKNEKILRIEAHRE